MKQSKIFCIVLTSFLFFGCLQISAKTTPVRLYVFGISISFTDSVTYITDIHTIEPAYIESKTGFMYDRSIYSQQLQVWVEENKNKPYTTCAIFFGTNKKKVMKLYTKLRDKYLKSQSTIVHDIKTEEFTFTPIEWTEHEAL